MGFEPTYDGFANRCLTTWLPRHEGADRERRLLAEPLVSTIFSPPPPEARTLTLAGSGGYASGSWGR